MIHSEKMQLFKEKKKICLFCIGTIFSDKSTHSRNKNSLAIFSKNALFKNYSIFSNGRISTLE